MHVICENNVDQAMMSGLRHLNGANSRIETDSRNGKVWKAITPVTTVWAPDASYISIDEVRNANPFFHLMEALWMLAGRKDLEFVTKYAANMAQFSDDGGVTQPGAYGYRWRHHFDHDQLGAILGELRANPASRRVVLSMWDGFSDPEAVHKNSADVPCNTHAYFDLSGGSLDMTVCCRSNDIVWGCYGSNVVHFSMLLELVAGVLGVPRGRYYQMSNNFHLYVERPDVVKLMKHAKDRNFFSLRPTTIAFSQEQLVTPKRAEAFLAELKNLDELTGNSGVPFLDRVAWPMQRAWTAHKAGDSAEALEWLGTADVDWLVAGRLWLNRAIRRKAAKTDRTPSTEIAA